MDSRQQALLNPDIVRQVLSFLWWDDLDRCRLVCQTWNEEVGALRKPRPPVPFSLERGRVVADGIQRNPAVISFVFLRARWSEFQESLTRVKRYLDRDQRSLPIVYAAGVFRRTRFSVIGGALLRGLSIPKIEGVQVDIIKLTSLRNSIYEDPCWSHLRLIISKNIVKCVLIFAHVYLFGHYGDVMSFISRNQPDEPQFAIGGGVFDWVSFEGESHRKNYNLVLFSVPKSLGSVGHFKAYSNILPKNKLKPKDEIAKLDDEFKLMSERVSPLKYTIAFKFRGWSRPNIEDEIFASYFPTISVIASTTREEYGIKNFLGSENESSEKSKKTDKIYNIHQKSISLVILTWK